MRQELTLILMVFILCLWSWKCHFVAILSIPQIYDPAEVWTSVAIWFFRNLHLGECPLWNVYEGLMNVLSGLIYTSTHGIYASYKRLTSSFLVLFLVCNKADWFLFTYPFLKDHFLLQSSPSSFIPDDQWEKEIDNCPTFKLGNCKYHSLQ